MASGGFLKSEYARRYVKCALICVPVLFAMSWLPPKLSGESIKEYARSHPYSLSGRFEFAAIFSVLIAAPLAIRCQSAVFEEQDNKE